jgi:hypothetical protein
VSFAPIPGVQTSTGGTLLNSTTYPQIFLAGFQQQGTLATASVTEIYFTPNVGTLDWDIVMSAENSSGNSYTINYYYK